MAVETKRPGKTEVLSMRMDAKTRFMLEILSRYRGQSISTVVERALMDVSDKVTIGSHDSGKTWRDYWHVSEGVRALLVSADSDLFPNYEEEYRLEFAKTHWPFFYLASDRKFVRTPFVDILWPHIDDFLVLWENTQAIDYWAAGKAMQKALSSAGIKAPEWPTPAPSKPEPKDTAGGYRRASGPSWDAPKGGDLDDEIPF